MYGIGLFRRVKSFKMIAKFVLVLSLVVVLSALPTDKKTEPENFGHAGAAVAQVQPIKPSTTSTYHPVPALHTLQAPKPLNQDNKKTRRDTDSQKSKSLPKPPASVTRDYHKLPTPVTKDAPKPTQTKH